LSSAKRRALFSDETMMTGMVAMNSRATISLTISAPVMTGMLISATTTSIQLFSMAESASLPSAASTISPTSKPEISIAFRIMWRTTGESSTTKMR